MSAVLAKNIDDILGVSSQRYFGAGYKQVQHSIQDVNIDPNSKQIKATVCINYPTTWSKKNTSKELKPHLSTIDAFVVAAQVCDAFVSYCYQLSDGLSKRIWIRELSIRAGRGSVLELNDIPLSGELVSSATSEDSLNGYLSEFEITLGGFIINLVLDHSLLASNLCHEPIQFDCVEELLGQNQTSIYGHEYTHIKHNIQVLNLNATSIDATLRLERESNYNPTSGLGAAFSGCTSPLDLLVCAAQLSQVLIYHLDDLDRTDTKNLWMRSVKVHSPHPLVKSGATPIKVATKKSRLVNKGNECWRTADVLVTTDADPDFVIESSIAHEILAGKLSEKATS